MRGSIVAVVITLLFAASVPPAVHAAPPDDRVALQGIRSGKGVFDINLAVVDKFPLYLQVIKETDEGLKRQGIKPELIVAIRGGAVRFVSSNRMNFSPDQRDDLEHAEKLIHELAKLGVRFEACAIATRLYHVDNASIINDVKVVGNTFISLIGYQARGYAVIAIQ